jgi:hypothetical protein
VAAREHAVPPGDILIELLIGSLGPILPVFPDSDIRDCVLKEAPMRPPVLAVRFEPETRSSSVSGSGSLQKPVQGKKSGDKVTNAIAGPS